MAQCEGGGWWRRGGENLLYSRYGKSRSSEKVQACSCFCPWPCAQACACASASVWDCVRFCVRDRASVRASASVCASACVCARSACVCVWTCARVCVTPECTISHKGFRTVGHMLKEADLRAKMLNGAGLTARACRRKRLVRLWPMKRPYLAASGASANPVNTES